MKINLSALTDAELGRMVRAALLTVVVDEMTAAAPIVAAQRAETEIDRQALLAHDQHERTGPDWHLAGFTVGTLTVPALDLTTVVLGELVPSQVRSAYNRARFRLGHKDVLDKDATTWADLREIHRELAAQGVSTPVETESVATKPVTALLAEIDPAKVALLAQVAGITEAQARARVAAL